MNDLIPAEALNQHVAVLGKTRSGKSSVMRGLVENLLDQKKPVCIIDPKGDWWGIKLAKDGKRAGYPVVIFGGNHADVPINAHAGAHVAELFATDNRPCLIDLGGWMVGERTRFYIDFASTLFRLTRGQRWLVIDEVHNFAPKGKVMDPDAGKALHWTNRLASEGLGKGITMLFASQRPQKVHNDTLTSAETLVAMRVLHPSDRGAVADWVKGCGDMELGNKVLNSLAQMERGEGWLWSPEIDLGPKRVKFPMFKTYDSFRPQTAEDTASLKGWASVDLDDVKAKLAIVVKEVEANDPTTLKRRIAELERDAKKAKPGTEASSAALEQRYQQGRREGSAGEYDRGYTDGAVAAISEVRKRVKLAMGPVQSAVFGIVDDGLGAAAGVFNVTKPPHTNPVPAIHRPPEVLARIPAGKPVEKLQMTPAIRRQIDAEIAEVGLTPSDRKVLDALAAFESFGMMQPTRTSAGFFAGYSKGGRYNNIVSSLNSRGLLHYPSDGLLALTDAGRAHANAGTSINSLQDLHASWLGKLPPSEAKVLRVVLDCYPDRITREALGEATDYQKGGRFNNVISRLKSLGTLSYPRDGEVVASADMFPEGLA